MRVAAAYSPGAGAYVELTFDRAVSLAGGVDASAVSVGDGDDGTLYAGTAGATLVAPATVRVPLAAGGSWFDPGVTLNATAATGIVAADDGGTWAGAEGLDLPWP